MVPRSVLPRSIRLRWLRLVGVILIARALLPARPIAAATGAADVSPPETYQVRPGDTLADIADRFGVTTQALMRLNAIQDPRRIYVGQTVLLGRQAMREGIARTLTPSLDLLESSRAAGMDPEPVAKANGLLCITGLPQGLQIVAPRGVESVVTSVGEMMATAPRVAAALRYRISLWDVLRLNPLPGTMGQRLLLPVTAVEQTPEAAPETDLPYPIAALEVSPQPMARGETAVIRVTTMEAVACSLAYLGATEDCLDHDGSGLHWAGLVGLPAQLEVGVTPVSVRVQLQNGAEVEVVVSLLVSAGRYDYERIDLPPDRQSLLDPTASQAEAAKIAALRTVRSPTRYWTYPFGLPVQSAVTSYFGSRRSYGYGFGSYHAGTDFDGEVGMPVVAPSPGVVVLAEPLVVRGHAILIDHGWGIVTGYWHLSSINVEVGQAVAAGELIGLLGNTGLSTGAHLHWELWVNGVAVNVLSWLEPDGPAALLDRVP